jgi:stress response protein SCP2
MTSRLPDGGIDGTAMVVDELARAGREWVFAPAATSVDGDEGGRTHRQG